MVIPGSSGTTDVQHIGQPVIFGQDEQSDSGIKQ